MQTLKAGLGGVAPRHLVPGVFVSVLALSGGAALVHPAGLWALGLVLGSYALGDLACSVQAARKHGGRVLLLLALACIVLTFFTPSVALGMCCMLLTLVLIVLAMMMLLSSRVGDTPRMP